MKQIKTLVDLRQRIGISQDTMAEYLLVNRSTVSMAEIGTRSLPKEAVMKLAKLEACFAFVTNGKNAKKPLPFAEVDQQQWHKLATEWNFRILGNTRSKQQLVKQLQAMSNQFTNAVQWHRVVELLIAENAKKKTATTEQRWLNNQQAQAAGVMLVSGPPAQQMLQLKIDMLDADTALLQQYLQTYA